eukprot:TRINITY_DN31759_c0_g1_i1.p1 TRINITY_DN31759_c0_g1~~TRINITY_DN31759_c0_g1_i1.p1  ORF type:complete len:190 (-),score=39.72 TRINITY_DN31759_c0_g1_i1:213-782(-)
MVTPDYVNQLTEPTPTFLCSNDANVYGINFTNFKIRAIHEQGGESLLFEVGMDPMEAERLAQSGYCPPAPEDDSQRFIRYHFGPHFLYYPYIGTTLQFSAQHPLENFRMIERHYFRNQLVRSYDFTAPFVIPNATSTWEVIYEMPELNDEWKAAVIGAPWETKSDSFYFVNDVLVMHNRAEYNYSEQEQ